ncbi:MAG: hypothetical protein JO002_06140 [Burkholderiaceae bacterium]|nr:hypothetical protein [Burkholderiaceae bacterium]
MTEPEQIAAVEPAPVIWNPNAAANWCLLFTPAFGAYLHMLNWRALGDSKRAASSRAWFYSGMGLLVFYLLSSLVIGSKASDAISRLVGLVYLLSWYFASARPQARYVKERWGSDYVRRPWGKALAYALGGFLVYLLIAAVIGVMAAIVQVTTTPSQF